MKILTNHFNIVIWVGGKAKIAPVLPFWKKNPNSKDYFMYTYVKEAKLKVIFAISRFVKKNKQKTIDCYRLIVRLL